MFEVVSNDLACVSVDQENRSQSRGVLEPGHQLPKFLVIFLAPLKCMSRLDFKGGATYRDDLNVITRSTCLGKPSCRHIVETIKPWKRLAGQAVRRNIGNCICLIVVTQVTTAAAHRPDYT